MKNCFQAKEVNNNERFMYINEKRKKSVSVRDFELSK